MNKYEKKMNDLVKDFGNGIWFQNTCIKVGYSFAEVYIDDDDMSINSEDDYILYSGTYVSWEDVFEENEDVKFVITKDCAESDNFITWQEFKDALDGKKEVKIVSI